MSPRGLHWIETKATKTGEDGEVRINTVEDNKISYTCFSYLRAKLARKLQRIIRRPSVNMLKRIIGRNLITNFSVNIAEVNPQKKSSAQMKEASVERQSVQSLRKLNPCTSTYLWN